MSLLSWLLGRVFCDLLQQGRETERLIARKDASLLAHTTPELERYFDKPPTALPRQNAFPVAIVLLLLLMAFALNLLTLLQSMPNVAPPAHALSFFVPSLAMIMTLMVSSFLLARGFNAGLAGFFWLLGALLLLTVGQLIVGLIIGGGSAGALLLACALLASARIVVNGRGFVLFVLYCRTRRITSVARGIRLRQKL